MTRLYEVTPDHAGWDQYVGFVVRARTAKEAREIAQRASANSQDRRKPQVWTAKIVRPERGPVGVILDSFQAG